MSKKLVFVLLVFLFGLFALKSFQKPVNAQTETPTSYPVITKAQNCPLKSEGDANCDGQINNTDLDIWKCQFKANGTCAGHALRAADFDLKNGVELNDFEIFRRTRHADIPTSAPATATPGDPTTIETPNTPTPVDAAFEQYASPAQYAGKTIQELCKTKGAEWNCTPSCSYATDNNVAYFRSTSNSTITDNNCYYKVPSLVTYLSACCDNHGVVPPTPEPPTKLNVFLSEATQGNIGGVEGANRLCRVTAEKKTFDPEGEFRAWISTAEVNAKDNIKPDNPNLPYYSRTTGQKIANSYADLLDGTLLGPIAAENYVPKPYIYTGTNTEGVFNTSNASTPVNNCENWISANSADTFSGGRFDATDGKWTFDTGTPACSSFNFVYCFQVR